MWRYLKEAFWARVNLPAAGPLPVNALAVLGVGILGCAEHALWLLGVGLETAYLYLLATNPRFQKVITARDHWQAQQSSERSRRDLLAQLSPESRARLERLEDKIRRAVALSRGETNAGLLGDSNLDAMEKLAALHLRLLGVEHDLQAVQQQTDEAGLARQAAILEQELQAGGGPLSTALRESKQATLALTQKRLANAKRRAESIAEVGSDLARIEAQVELALEDASLGGKPTIVASNLNLLNRILESNSALRNDSSLDWTIAPAGMETRSRDSEG